MPAVMAFIETDDYLRLQFIDFPFCVMSQSGSRNEDCNCDEV